MKKVFITSGPGKAEVSLHKLLTDLSYSWSPYVSEMCSRCAIPDFLWVPFSL